MVTTPTANAALQIWAKYERTAQGDPGAVVIDGSQTGRTGRETGRPAAG